MNSADKKIAEVLAKFDEPMAGNVWRVQGTAVIYHKTLERIAAQAKISFDEPKIIRAERDEAVIQVMGRLGERVEWSVGEALIGVNYRVSGKQAAYVYAMAEKRAKDRVILKLIELSGDVYSEEEADEFKHGHPGNGTQTQEQEQRQPANDQPEYEPDEVTEWKQKISKLKTINAVTDLMLHADTQKALNDMSVGFRDAIRDHAKQKLLALGWPTKQVG
jgi:hypothetical protein